MSEHSELVKDIVKAIVSRGGVASHVWSGIKKAGNAVIHGAEPGTLDVIGCFMGRYIAVDAKVLPDKPSDEQLEFAEKVNNAGGLAFFAYEVETVYTALSEIEQYLERSEK